MTDFQGAMGIVQMSKLGAAVGARQSRAARYDEAFGQLAGVSTPVVPDGYEHTYQSYVLLLEPATAARSRDSLALELQRCGIATRQGTHAVHLLGYYRRRYGLGRDDFPAARYADANSLSLPLYPTMSDEEQAYVINNIRELLS
jgi:dTDP-4-amino-4,6-dideoxygalactose transaminase